jgi:RHS repeat-associated protein
MVRVYSGKSATEYYIWSDNLNTPRVVTDASNNFVWRWDSDAYGNGAANGNPLGVAGQNFVFNLRFPGQYFDAETGLNYNWNRDYNPVLGRYVESDPIGFVSGSASMYGYVDEDPLALVDPEGLQVLPIRVPRAPVFGGYSPVPGAGSKIDSVLNDGAGGGRERETADQARSRETTCQPGRSCPPCSPYAVGTVGWYGPHDQHDHRPVGRPHIHLKVVNQRKSDCKCFWNELRDAVSPPPNPAWINLNAGLPPLVP